MITESFKVTISYSISVVQFVLALNLLHMINATSHPGDEL